MKTWVRQAETVSGRQRLVPSLKVHLALGLAQGFAFYALYLWAKNGGWTTHRPMLVGLAQFSMVLPLAWTLLAGSYWSESRRVLLASLIGLVAAGLSWYAIEGQGSASEPLPFWYLPALLVFLFVSGHLIAGFDPRSRVFDYPRHFELAWRNSFLVPIAAALTATLWALLWAAAWLFMVIGFNGLSDLLQHPATIAVTSSSGLFVAIALALRRAEVLVSVRRFWLSLNSWFLPVSLLLAVSVVAAVAVLGTEKFFGTGLAAAALLWFVSLAILFANAAYQDGKELPVYSAAVFSMTRWSWLAVPVLAALGAVALGMRVAAYGWTPERIWATLACAISIIYSAGYAASYRSTRWMATVPLTNVLAAGVLALTLVAFLTPIADVRRLSTESQVGRLRAGKVAPDKFDFRFLAEQGGRWGQAALLALGDDASLPLAVRERAAQARNARTPLTPDQKRARALANLAKVPVLPRGSALDKDLERWLTGEDADWAGKQCVAQPSRCAIWLVDLDKAGGNEGVLLRDNGQHASATLYERQSNGWREQGALQGAAVTIQAWMSAIEAGTVSLVPSKWPDVVVNGNRLTVR